MLRTLLLCCSITFIAACGPSSRDNCSAGAGSSCTGPCDPGDSRQCYDGASGTEGVGVCKGGNQTCDSTGTWGACGGEVTPTGEICGDGLDNNCNGMTDEDVDNDGDGFTTCQGDCCDSPNECMNPAQVNPGAFDIPGDGIDNDCDGTVDNAVLACDSGLAPASTDPMDFAKAIDLCQTTTMTSPKWGVISATYSLANGTGTPGAGQHVLNPKFGTSTIPKAGGSLAILGTGAVMSGANAYNDEENGEAGSTQTSPFPADFIAANGNKLPNAPGCPGPLDNVAHSPVMVTLTIRVPTNVQSFTLDTNFFSSEFPEWTCSEYNDFFVILLNSAYNGTPANPADHNLAFYSPDMGATKYPVGVNLADTGLFTQCVNGTTGCAGGTGGTISSCTATDELAGTTLDTASPGECGANSLEGGGTGWLQTTGNVNPGEIMTLRIAIWDTSDAALQSLALIDDFAWAGTPSAPGTVILRGAPPWGGQPLEASQIVSETTSSLSP